MKNLMKSFEQLPVELVKVDKSYQRSLSYSRAKKIAKDFDPVGVGLILVHKRDDGFYYVLDGQHRFTAMKILGFQKIDCNVFEGMTLEEEAKAFDFYNNIKNINRLERGKARFSAKDEIALKIDEVVQGHGHKIDYENVGNGIRAYSTLEAIYKSIGEDGLSGLLTLLNKIYPAEKDALGKDMMFGLFLFIKDYEGKFKEKVLIKNLQRATINGVLSKARILASANGYVKQKGVKAAITYYYDFGRREKLGET